MNGEFHSTPIWNAVPGELRDKDWLAIALHSPEPEIDRV